MSPSSAISLISGQYDSPSALAAGSERERVARELGSQYQVVRELGRGGMGVVFLARDLALHRLIAIKVLRHELMRVPEHRERFLREGRTTARLNHPNIVSIFAFGETRSLLYFVMPYVHGESLASRIQRDGRLGWEETASVIASLALALDHAHREGVVHRDLKAENILIARESGMPVLTDFGVSTLRSLDPSPADARRAFGTPQYMSPEQAAGELDVDGRSDLYALGVLAYLMLTGEMPFDGQSFTAIAAKHLTQAPVAIGALSPGTPAWLVAIIDRCLAKDRTARWRRGGEMHAAIVSGGERGARPSSGWARRVIGALMRGSGVDVRAR
ncbi:MAG: serine/threonine protein kinase [Gemmatimonadota bacterium]|nr:serine/threonine protein kinase [Gemmatimonadota bacterium]